MSYRRGQSPSLNALRYRLRDVFWGPQLLAFLPAICLSSYWIIGEGGLIVTALGIPLVWSVMGGFTTTRRYDWSADLEQAVTPQDSIIAQMTQVLQTARADDRSAVFAIALDDGDNTADHFDSAVLHDLRDQMHRRLRSMLRDSDLVVLSDSLQWIVALKPGVRLDLEVVIQQASRLQGTTDEPFITGRTRHYFTSTVGFRLVRASDTADPAMLLRDAQDALQAALLGGPGSVRSFAPNEPRPAAPSVAKTQFDLTETDKKLIVPWFQPQISTDTGDVSGFEALARMNDPDRGILPPAAFLPAIEAAGQLEHLSETMLIQGLEALNCWDSADLGIDTIGINYSGQDLSNPQLYDKIAWELDRREVAPQRLCIEILESVIAAGSDDMVTRNVVRLAKLGCQIDLDDFGTGHASISTLKRLPVSRLKIDRSFVARADLDPEQQKMAATILMMAERLGLNTLAEGVETVGEHAILAQLGCGFVQGYGIAKPMPLAETIAWTTKYRARLQQTPSIDRKTGT